MKRYIFLSIFLFLFATFIFANDVSVSIYSNKESVVVGEMFKVSVEATGTQSLNFVEEPDFGDSISQIRSEQSMSSSWVNGSFSSSSTTTYYLRATEEGTFTIGPFKARVKKNVYETNQITIKVVKNNANTSNNTVKQSNNGENNVYSAVDRSNRNYLIKLNVDKNSAYKNEPILISVDLYIRSQIQTISYDALKLPSSAWIENLSEEQNYKGREIIDNIQYDHYEIEKKRVFIAKEGKYEIPSVVYNFHGLTSNRGWFSSFEPMTLMTQPTKITIKPLPSVPNGSIFSGLIGKFDYKANVNQNEISAKDITTLTITLSGNGNFHSIQNVDFEIDDTIDVFSSKNSTSDLPNGNKTKTWEILLQPNEEGKRYIRVPDLLYFDCETGKYQFLKGKNIEIFVKQQSKYKDDTDNSKVLHYSDDNKQKNVINEITDITYIKTSFGKNLKKYDYKLWFDIFVFGYIAIVLLLVLFVFMRFVIFKNSTEENIQANKTKNAYKKFSVNINKFIRECKKDSKKSASEQIDKLSQIIEKYFIERLNLHSVEITAKGLDEKLSNFVNEQSLKQLHDLILDFDMIRYGGLDANVSLVDFALKICQVIKQIEHETAEKQKEQK